MTQHLQTQPVQTPETAPALRSVFNAVKRPVSVLAGTLALAGGVAANQQQDALAQQAPQGQQQPSVSPEEEKAWGCRDNFFRNGADVSASESWHGQRITKFPVRNRKVLTFMVSSREPTPPTIMLGADCDSAGDRTIDMRVEMSDKKGKRHPYSPWVNVVKNSNESVGTLPPPNELYVKVPLRKPYTCLPGKPKRQFWVATRLTPNYSPLPPEAAHFSNQKIVRQKGGKDINRSFKPC